MRYREVIESHFEVSERFGDELVIPCPAPDHEDSSPSAWVNATKGLWVCYSCGAGGSLEDILPHGVRVSKEFSDSELEEILAHLEPPLHQRVEALSRYLVFEERYDYWCGVRGLSSAAVDHFLLGFDPDNAAATYPVHDPCGKLLGIVKRRTDGLKPKYRYPTGVRMHNHLFGMRELLGDYKRNLILTEGAIDAMAMWDADLVQHGVLAQYGSTFSATQAQLLRSLSPLSVTLVFDNDQAGRDAVRWVTDQGVDEFTLVKVATYEGLEDYKDPAEVPRERRHLLVSTARNIT